LCRRGPQYQGGDVYSVGWEGAVAVGRELSCLSSCAITSSCEIIIPRNRDSVNITQPLADIRYDRYRTCCWMAFVGSMLMPARNQPSARRRPNMPRTRHIVQEGTLNEDRVELRVATFSGGGRRRVFAAEERTFTTKIKEHRGRCVYTGSAGCSIAVLLASRWRHHNTASPATHDERHDGDLHHDPASADSIAPEANDDRVTVPNTRKSLNA
jgi:hypothetical protein